MGQLNGTCTIFFFKNLKIAPEEKYFFFFQGTFVGMLSSLIFTMWFGFGATASKNFGTLPSGPKKEFFIYNCSEAINATYEKYLASTTTTTLAPDVEP